MKVVLQRVSQSSVTVDEKLTATIEKGLMLLVGFGKSDEISKLRPMAEKVLNMRIFPDEKGRFHYSCLDVSGGVLLVPQFTLYADTGNGRRPEFFEALEPAKATELFDEFVKEVSSLGVASVQTGIFGAHMKVALENDGPVTICLEN